MTPDHEPIIFLDVDGVLNCHEYDPEILCGQIHGDKVELLNFVLRATGAKIVLSSAWRYIVYRGEANLMGMEWLFRSHGLLANRLVGLTRPDTMVRAVYSGVPDDWPLSNERGDQIVDWLNENGGRNRPYIVLDDGGKDRQTGEWSDLGLKALGNRVVWCDGRVGLTRGRAEQAIELLTEVLIT